MSDQLRVEVEVLAKRYSDATRTVENPNGSKLFINSGYRTPSEQASAMKKKFDGEGNKDYPGPLGTEVFKAYTAAKAAGENPVEKMTATIEAQVADGKRISKHMVNNAIDIRVKDLTMPEWEALVSIAQPPKYRLKFEEVPFHGHLEFLDVKE